MSSTKKQRGVILLEKNSLDFYTSATGSVYKLAFPQNAVNNFEMIDVNAFSVQVKTFFDTNKILPSSIILILAESALFIKSYSQSYSATAHVPSQAPGTKQQDVIPPAQTNLPIEKKEDEQKIAARQLAQFQAEQQADIQRFFDYVPFETVLSKTYKINGQTIAVATNGDFIDMLRKILENMGSHVDLALPVHVLPTQVHVSNGLTQDAANILLEKQLSFKQYNMLTVSTLTIPSGKMKESLLHGQANRIRFFAMIGIFVLLVIVAVIMFMNMQQENQRLRSNATPANLSVTLPGSFK